MSNALQIKRFGDINYTDVFFDSLRDDYLGFDKWFAKKAREGETAFVLMDDAGLLEGFLYLKQEQGEITDVVPLLPAANRIKIGTFKIQGHGTKIGERFVKKAFDQAVTLDADEIYVTVFAKHAGLIRLFDKYGFVKVSEKASASGDVELVLVRNLRSMTGDVLKDYPFVQTKGYRKCLLAIYPKWHTQLLPDSILNNESFDVVKDLSHTNSIHKVYISKMPVENLKPGDILVMYRTKDPDESGSAEYKSVATSICVVEEARRVTSFPTEADFLSYCRPYSVFSDPDLKKYYADKMTRVIKFTYNVAMSKRLIRKILIEDVGINRDDRPSFLPLTDSQFNRIVQFGGVNENFIID